MILNKDPTMLIYSPDAHGLGHLRRNSILAKVAVGLITNLNVIIIGNCPSNILVDIGSRIDFVKLPSVKRGDVGVWNQRFLNLPGSEFWQIRLKMLEVLFNEFKPTVLIVDHLPLGIENELEYILPIAKSFGTKIILGIRDILGHPDLIKGVWTKNGSYNALYKYYDNILIFGEEKFYPTATLYNLADLPHTYLGYITDCSRKKITKASDKKSRIKRLIVTSGGGADVLNYLIPIVDALKLLKQYNLLEIILIVGPLASEKTHSDIRERIKGSGMKFLRSVDDMPELISKADIVITMGGYNTIMESFYFRKNIICVPRVDGTGEQLIRSNLLTERGILKQFNINHPFSNLVQTIQNAIDIEGDKNEAIKFTGMNNFAIFLKSVLEEKTMQSTINHNLTSAI